MLNSEKRTYSLEEYCQLVEMSPDHKYEYTEGQIRMMTGGTPAHGQITTNISSLLFNALRETECNVYSSDVALNLSNRRQYYPDVSVSCDPADWTRTKALEAPSVVVEVLSPSTEFIDNGEKLAAYQNYPTIQEILLVNARKRLVEHYHRVTLEQWQRFIYTSNDDVVQLTNIDVSLAVKDIYHKVYLELEDTL
jgi:Uma2 family endonuclease